MANFFQLHTLAVNWDNIYVDDFYDTSPENVLKVAYEAKHKKLK